MSFFRFLIISPVVCALAQTPATPPPASIGVPRTPASIAPGQMATIKPPALPAVPPDKVVFTLGEVTFTAAQFDNLLASTRSRVPPGPNGRRQFAQTLEQMLVLADEGRRRKLDETPDYKMQALLATSNVLAGVAYSAIMKDFKVSDEAVRKYYDEHPTEFETVKARHILIRFKGSRVPLKPGETDLSEADALAKAQDIRKKIVAGADFAELAKTESDDSGSAVKGGDLGSFGHGQMEPAFETAAFALKVGDVSEPVRTQYGYHIIQLQEKQSKTFDEARPELEKRLATQEASKQARETLDEMVKKSGANLDPDYFGAPPAPPAMPVKPPAPAAPAAKQ